jgi:aspartokinase/homoserine dehydrogenase 1
MSRDPYAAKPHVLLVGTGVVGGAFLEMLRGPCRVRLAGVANRRGVAFARRGETTASDADVAALLAKPTRDEPLRIDDAVLDELEALPEPVLVDATASDEVSELYLRALERGIHVVTANKKPIAGPWAVRERLFDPSIRSHGTKLRYEATVGAGLPVIETLKDLVRTGDQVRRIDCVLSGTLGFLCNALANGGVTLSSAIATAKQRGYTEPDAREDLGGADVARKAVILAREIGASIELSDVDLEPFVPREALARARPSSIDRDLADLDADFAARASSAAKRGEKLVYLARIEANGTNVRASAGPVVVPRSHPAAQLEGSSALVAFTTARYPTDPLVVRGSGAGGAVTASAVLADILKATGHT